MRMIKSLVLGAVSLLALASWAQAADLVGRVLSVERQIRADADV